MATKARVEKQRDLFTKAWRIVRPPPPDERQIQIALIDHVRLRRRPGVICFHVPNGGLRDKREAALLRAMGVRAGVPDLVFIWSDLRELRVDPGAPIGVRILFLELKTQRGRTTPLQTVFMDEASAIGCDCKIAHSIDEALAILTQYDLIK